MNTKFYVVTHKNFNQPTSSEYKTIVVGNNKVNMDNVIYDNTGYNISEKNKNYCELTALYWIWKNEKSNDIIGINHYRRYFLEHSIFFEKHKILSKFTAEKILKKHDIILPFPRIRLHYSVAGWFLRTDGKEKDIKELRNVIVEHFPVYLDSYDKVMNGNEASYYNMMVISKDLFDRYCEWLFEILFELERRTDLTGYSNTEARIFGFISERLLNVWVIHNHLKVKYLDVFETEKKTNYYELLKDRAKHLYLICRR